VGERVGVDVGEDVGDDGAADVDGVISWLETITIMLWSKRSFMACMNSVLCFIMD
jgi:hypothetical protein